MHPIEPLEPRRLMSASLNHATGLLTVLGTPQNDVITVRATPAGRTVVTQSSPATGVNQTWTFPTAKVKQIVARGGARNDVIRLDPSVRVPATLYGHGTPVDPFVNQYDELIGGSGNDRLVASGVGSVSMYGGAGNDRLDCANNPNVAEALGGAGDDTFVRVGAGTFAGGAGRDTADFSDQTVGRVIGNRNVMGYYGWTHHPGDGAAVLSGFEVFNGTQGDDLIFGSDGNDVLRGNGGDDVLAAFDGQDQLFGGDGDDFLAAVDGWRAPDVVSGGAGTDDGFHDDWDVVSGLERRRPSGGYYYLWAAKFF